MTDWDTDYGDLTKQLGIRGRRGRENFNAHCPFHRDRDASLSVQIWEGWWTCFSCHEKGVFSRLAMLVMKCTLTEAERWIAENRHAAPIPEQRAIPTVNGKPVWLANFEMLDNAVIPEWLLYRGITWESINRWDIRWNPDDSRIYIPVHDYTGTLVGTIGRIISSAIFLKYKNSEGLPRGETLLGIHRHLDASTIVLTEGVLDAVWLDQLGIPSAGLMGTQLTEGQVRLLQRYDFERVILAMDNDRAGKEATSEHVDILLEAGFRASQLRAINYGLLDCKDIQECAPTVVHALIRDAGPAMYVPANKKRKKNNERY